MKTTSIVNINYPTILLTWQALLMLSKTAEQTGCRRQSIEYWRSLLMQLIYPYIFDHILPARRFSFFCTLRGLIWQKFCVKKILLLQVASPATLLQSCLRMQMKIGKAMIIRLFETLWSMWIPSLIMIHNTFPHILYILLMIIVNTFENESFGRPFGFSKAINLSKQMYCARNNWNKRWCRYKLLVQPTLRRVFMNMFGCKYLTGYNL